MYVELAGHKVGLFVRCDYFTSKLLYLVYVEVRRMYVFTPCTLLIIPMMVLTTYNRAGEPF
jgi:hypothetical protein